MKAFAVYVGSFVLAIVGAAMWTKPPIGGVLIGLAIVGAHYSGYMRRGSEA